MQRFTRVTLEISLAVVEILMSAFVQGLREGDFFHLLAKKPPHDYDELPTREKKYINMKEAHLKQQGSYPIEIPELRMEAWFPPRLALPRY